MILLDSMELPVIICLVIASVLSLAVYFWNDSKLRRKLEKLGEVKGGLPLIGIAHEFFVDSSVVFQYMMFGACCSQKTGTNFLRIGPRTFVVVFKASAVESVLANYNNITKSSDYDFVVPWLATGLLTSTGQKWKSRRKLITPSFHFQILENFMAVYNEQSEILIDILSKKIGMEFDICPSITNCTLDIICDSVMGTHVNAQHCEDSEYVKAIERIKSIIHKRQFTFCYWPDWIFYNTSLGREQTKCLKILHSFTDKVIKERQAERKQMSKPQKSESISDFNFSGKKRRLALLDLLLEASNDGKDLSNSDIREEVDTFMFEGHDTSAVAISWAIYLIGLHPEIQEKVYEELNVIFDGDKRRPVTSNDLKEMKYLECTIKESLRLFPSVPIIGRKLDTDLEVEGAQVPAGITIIVATYCLHRDPTIFPNPEVFDPDRFRPENSYGRHPYAYVPFSAGPRNCIGQKFAMMEEKVVLSHLLRSFKIRSVQPGDEIDPLPEIVLRSKHGIIVELTPRP